MGYDRGLPLWMRVCACVGVCVCACCACFRIVLSWDEDDYTDNNQILVSLLDPNSDIFTAGA